MRIPLSLILPGLLVLLLSHLGGCGCGFDCNSNSDNNPASLTLGLSDSLPEDLKQVVIEVDSITFRRSATSEVVVDTFDIAERNLTNQETFKIDLLQYPGVRQLVVIDGLELPVGTYESVDLKLLVGSIENSFVQQQDDTFRPLTVANASGVLTLPGMQLGSGTQRFVIEFGLAQSLRYQSTPNNYLLATTGIRVENTVTDATLSGQVDNALFNSVAPCSEKTDPLVGNRVYLYQGRSLAADNLADVFTTASSTTVPANAQAPFAVASMRQDSLTGRWNYGFGYVPAGDYTLAFSCNTEADDAVNFDNLAIPLPTGQKYEITLAKGDDVVCNLAGGAKC